MTPATLNGRFLFLGGLLLPILGTILVAVQDGLSLPGGLWTTQRTTPWLWLLDLVPVVLAFYGRFLALPANASGRNVPLLISILILLFLVPCSAMLYARQHAQLSIQSNQTLRQAATLQMLVLRTYISFTQKNSGEVRQELAQMSELRKRIQTYSPSAVHSTERTWSDFYQAATRGSLTFKQTLQLRDAIDRLVRDLETDSKHANTEASQLLLSGVAGTFVLMGLTLQLFYQLRQLEGLLLLANQKQTKTNQQLEATNAKLNEANERLQSINQELTQTTTRDPLTGLFNRRAFDEAITAEWARALRYSHPLTVMMVDIDYFKSYNDSFGHVAGDAVLETIGTLLQHALRGSDFAARYGGEEFIVLMPHTSEEEAVRTAERIRAGIQGAPWKNRVITVSIGVAERTANMHRISELVTAADIALFQAKKTRDRVCNAKSFPTAGNTKAA